jgi:hypothetical protein
MVLPQEHEFYPLIEESCRRLLSEQNRDPYAPAYGCFDRRYWGWKLVDFPEATFQRNVYPLSWMLKNTPDSETVKRTLLFDAVKAGLQFAKSIQHKDGSFDQAFPNEHSYGATAFLLHPLMEAFKTIQWETSAAFRQEIEESLYRAADFLCRNDETHGFIANHRAGAALSLFFSAAYFSDKRFKNQAAILLDEILTNQSAEGWFIEYEGADPGYQTLCVYYLAQIMPLYPDEKLKTALFEAVAFLSWFIHPDGTFGGEYGCRRTPVYYSGGIALLGSEIPLARRMTDFMQRSIVKKNTISAPLIDIGNLAPLLSNYVLAAASENPVQPESLALLPCETEDAYQDFRDAGLFIRGTKNYYAVFGASNGGALKVFDRQKDRVLWNDGGYAGQMEQGEYVTTQMTKTTPDCEFSQDQITLTAPFYKMLRSTPTPFQFVLFRILNLTVMRNTWLGNRVKDLLVRMLISGKKAVPLTLERSVIFGEDSIRIEDVIRQNKSEPLRWLTYGRSFVSIHMASARYFERFPEQGDCTLDGLAVNVKQLHRDGSVTQEITI